MGIGEQIKGAVKQKVGDVTDDNALQSEGDAQQTKGEEETAENKDRAEAQAHEKKADALEKRAGVARKLSSARTSTRAPEHCSGALVVVRTLPSCPGHITR